MKYNFYAGPAILPREVIEESAQAIYNFNNTGLSILEISHRSKEFVAVMDEAVALVKELLHIGDDHTVIFLSGGASTQFSLVPLNLLSPRDKAAYVDTGTWATKAIKDGKIFGRVDIIASSKDKNYSYIPKGYAIDPTYKYLHLTSNNTIYGTQYKDFPITEVPLIGDMSSDIFSKEININRFDLIYAGAQKNLGPAGTTLVIIRKSALSKSTGTIGAMLDYNNHINGASMYNTPPVFPIYVSMLTLRWLKKNGGIAAIHKKNKEKAQLLYNEIDRNRLFYSQVSPEDRSDMNVCFHLHDIALTDAFLDACKNAGCIGLAGHRSVGGFRASIYNAMHIEGVRVLTEVMRTFETNHD